METNNQITANSKLGVYLKQVDSNDKVIIIIATNKYVNAKRTNGDTNTALNELLATFKQMEPKYGFTTFEENADVVALIDEFAACIEKGMAMLNSKTSYTCNFGSVAEANIWLAGQTNIILKKFNVATEGAGHKINNVIFEYTVSEQSTNVKYQVTEINKTRLYLKTNLNKFRRKWEAKNPQYTFVTSIYRNYAMRLFGGNAGYIKIINEKHIVLYSFKCN